MIDQRLLSKQQQNEMLEFIKNHIDNFGCLPVSFECSRGCKFTYSDIWEVASENKLTK